MKELYVVAYKMKQTMSNRKVVYIGYDFQKACQLYYGSGQFDFFTFSVDENTTMEVSK